MWSHPTSNAGGMFVKVRIWGAGAALALVVAVRPGRAGPGRDRGEALRPERRRLPRAGRRRALPAGRLGPGGRRGLRAAGLDVGPVSQGEGGLAVQLRACRVGRRARTPSGPRSPAPTSTVTASPTSPSASPGRTSRSGDDHAGAVTVVYGSTSGLDTRRSDPAHPARLAPAGHRPGGGGPDRGRLPRPRRGVAERGLHGDPGAGLRTERGRARAPRRSERAHDDRRDRPPARRAGRAASTSGSGRCSPPDDLNGDGTADLVVGSEGDRFIDDGYPGSVSVCLAQGWRADAAARRWCRTRTSAT